MLEKPSNRYRPGSLRRVLGVYVTYACVLEDGNLLRNTEYLRVRHGQVVSVDVYFRAMYRDGNS
jgi:hypothetical protein